MNKHSLTVAGLALAATAAQAAAQGAPPAASLPTPATTRCLVGKTAVRAVTGGAIGAWVGFVAAKIQVSDWNEQSHTSSWIRFRNRSTIGGAVIGAAVGSLLRVGQSCSPTLLVNSTTYRPGREPIVADEILKSGQGGNVYDLVHSLRPTWLNLRGMDALTEGNLSLIASGQEITLVGSPGLGVYLDNAKVGSIDELKNIPVAGVVAVRYFDATEATMRFGAGNVKGAIQVLVGLNP